MLSLQRMVGTYHPNRVVNEDHTVSAAHGNTETIDKEELQKALDEQHSTAERPVTAVWRGLRAQNLPQGGLTYV